MDAHDLLTKHFRLDKNQLSALRRLSVLTIGDLLYHFPARYEQAGAEGTVKNLVPGTKVTLIGKLSGLQAKKLWKSRRPATEGWFEDASGRVKVMWFNQPYIKSYVKENIVVKLTGTVGGKPERPYISNPEIEQSSFDETTKGLFAAPADPTLPAERQGLFPVYPESLGITSRWFYHALQRVFSAGTHTRTEDPIPEKIRGQYNLPDLASALLWLHVPEKLAHTEAARKRFAFEEIYVLQIIRAQERRDNDSGSAFPITDAHARAEKFISSLDVVPTGAQTRAIREILTDFSKPHPMARLLEGDVGSGKTLVAAAASYAAVTSRPPGKMSGTLQVAYMAPTEILAQQHFESFIKYFNHLPINIALLTSSGCKKFPSKTVKGGATSISKSQLLKWVAGGEIAMLVGTHALVQKSVQFQHLAVAIVDEQHRFGTRQRRALAHKHDAAPHFLSMTATPIPRTLALTLYGDLDISVLDELPPGRAKVTTQIVKPSDRAKAYEKIRDELKKGRQAYVICPRIEEPNPAKQNALQAKSAVAEAERLQKDVFQEYEIGLLHGAMKPDEKDSVMRAFTANKIQVLVATSVVEVGVNVPNATAIMIEGAERFGLAQLHQLRGRVMRSSHPPICFLVPETRGEVAMKRLRAMEKTDNGFILAEADLENRGAGDLYGSRQWGITDIGMEALKNPRLIQAARTEAITTVTADPTLSLYRTLAERVKAAALSMHTE
jgi:ATP-dependent DNA helicase RecG